MARVFLMKLHVVTVTLRDQRNGQTHSLAFTHHNKDAAEILRNVFLTVREQTGGAVHQFSAQDMSFYTLFDAVGQASIEVMEHGPPR